MYLHTPALEVGSWWRIDTASGSDTATTVYAHDGTDAIPTSLGVSGSTVRNTRADGTAQFWSSAATLYCKELTYQGAVTATVVTSVGYIPSAPGPTAPVDIATISAAVAALPATYASPRGAWSSVTAYTVNQVVTYNESTYRALASSTNVAPGTDATKWELWGGGGALVESGTWVTATHYTIGNVVSDAANGQRYACVSSHTSSGAFATDLGTGKWTTTGASRGYVDTTISAGAPDASTTAKGIVKLAGDLAGTATTPTVPGLTGKLDTTTRGAASGVASLDSSTLVPTAQLGTGSATSAKVLQGDRTWATAVTLAQSGQTPAQEPVAPGTTGVGTLAYAARADHVHASAGLYGWLGDGADGAATFDGSATPTGVTKVSSVLYRANADLHYTSITGSSGVTLEMAGYLLHSRGTLAGPGSGSFTIAFIPGAASGTNNGTAPGGGTNGRQATLGVGSTGGTGGTGAGASPASAYSIDYLVNSASGVSGGAGSNGAGGSGSTGTQNVGISQGMRRFHVATTGMRVGYDGSNVGNNWPPVILGGFGAGSGGGDGSNVGGAGGRGGGVCIVNAYTVTGNVTVTANGGAGGSPTTGNCGGGGGGNGGWAQLNSTDLTGWTGSVTASGGTHGTASGSGVNGTDGTAGIARSVTWR